MRSSLLALAAAAIAAGCSGSTASPAGVTDAWARPTPTGATNGVVYLSITTGSDDTISGVRVDASIAAEAQLHVTAPSGGAKGGAHADHQSGSASLTMNDVDEFALTAGTPFEFAPGGAHIMLVDLAAPLETGEHFVLELDMRSGDEVTAEVVVSNNAP